MMGKETSTQSRRSLFLFFLILFFSLFFFYNTLSLLFHALYFLFYLFFSNICICRFLIFSNTLLFRSPLFFLNSSSLYFFQYSLFVVLSIYILQTSFIYVNIRIKEMKIIKNQRNSPERDEFLFDLSLQRLSIVAEWPFGSM